MRSLLDTEEEEETKAAEITLSTASLLGIFFGLVLICGVFFGFGYSMGRGTGGQAQAAGLGNTPAEVDGTSSPQPAASAPAEVVEPDPQEAAKAAPPVEAAPEKKPVEEQADEEDAPPPPVKHITAVRPSAARPVAIQQAAAAPVTEPSGQPMVQIAAVARREDADVLVSALRQRGYGVVVRSEPQDKLLHVQVGPFADRTQATAMKQKLLSDGYNAIIKQ